MGEVTVQSSRQSPAAAFQALLDKSKAQIAMALPKHMNADRMARIALTVFRSNPAFAQCDPRSIIASVMTASQLGLEIGILGQAYLIPYKDTCTFVPGWQGLVDLVSRAGRATVWTGAVFEGDQFDYALGDRPYVTHRPSGEDDVSKMTHVYAIGRVNGQEWPIIEVWPIAKVVKHRDRYNKVGRKHYSYSHFEMYARKVALLQVLKYVPKSIELISAMTADTAHETGRTIELDKNGDILSITGGEEQQTQPAAEDVQEERAPAKDPPPVPGGELAKDPFENIPPSRGEVRQEPEATKRDPPLGVTLPPDKAPTTKVGSNTVNTRTGEILD